MTVGAEVAVAQRHPRELVDEMAAAAQREGISGAEAWRRAAREWLARRRR